MKKVNTVVQSDEKSVNPDDLIFNQIKSINDLLRTTTVKASFFRFVENTAYKKEGHVNYARILEDGNECELVKLFERLNLIKIDWKRTNEKCNERGLNYRYIYFSFTNENISRITDRTNAIKSILDKNTLISVTNAISKLMTYPQIEEFLIANEVSESLLIYPFQTTEDAVYTVLNYYASSPLETDNKILFKILSSACQLSLHPEGLKETFNFRDWLNKVLLPNNLTLQETSSENFEVVKITEDEKKKLAEFDNRNKVGQITFYRKSGNVVYIDYYAKRYHCTLSPNTKAYLLFSYLSKQELL